MTATALVDVRAGISCGGYNVTAGDHVPRPWRGGGLAAAAVLPVVPAVVTTIGAPANPVGDHGCGSDNRGGTGDRGWSHDTGAADPPAS